MGISISPRRIAKPVSTMVRQSAVSSTSPRTAPQRFDMTTVAADVSRMFTLTKRDFEEVRARIGQHIKHTPLLTSRQLSELSGYETRLKAEMFQRVGSYKIRGPLNKFGLLPEGQKRRGVRCSSAG